MGTRNITIVMKDKKTVVAQYGQWDGYPSGQGATVFNFLKTADLNHFKEKLNTTKFIDAAKQKEINEWFKSIGCKDGWMNGDQAELYHQKYPLLTRDNGAEILNMLNNHPDGEIAWIHNKRLFAADSLYCEWAYVIDLDKEVLEIYKGFNKEPLEAGQRFKRMKQAKNGKGETSEFYPVKCIKKFKFSELPETVGEYVALIEAEIPKEPEEE